MADAVADQLAEVSLDGQPGLDQVAPESQLSLRALCTTRDAGVIIGKGGKNVADLRLQTGVRAGVSKAVGGVSDRILSVTGTVEGISKAYTLIATNLLEAANQDDAQVPSTTIATSMSTVVRLLVAHSLMGSVIGKAGAKIKQIQESCGVRMVASKEMLPQSTERIVEVSGTPIAIGTAVKDISACLLADQERLQGTIFYHPGAVIGPDGAPLNAHVGGFGGISVLDSSSLAGYAPGQPVARGPRRPSQGAPLRGGLPPVKNDRFYSGSYNANSPPSPERSRLIAGLEPDDPNLRTQTISFPADMIGCIIGRGGTKIQEIRKLSGSRINISKDANPETGERLFSIVGTTETNEKALFLLYSSLEAEKERRASVDAQAQ